MAERSDELWILFLDEARGVLDRLRDDVRGLGIDAGEPARLLREVAAGLHALASGAALIGVDEIARVAAAAGRVVSDAVLGHLEVHAAAQPALAETVARLSDAVLFLSRPDQSGARLPDETLRELEQKLHALTAERRSLRPVASSPPELDDSRWVPQVDEDMIDPFIDECTERLDALAQKLLRLEELPNDTALVNDLFRDLHTIKGSSGFVGLGRMNKLAHAAEDLVGQVRQGTRAADRAVVDALLMALDRLRAVLDRATQRAAVDVPIDDVVARLRQPAGSIAEPPGAIELAPTDTLLVSGTGVSPRALRVDFGKLDLLMNLVGELVLAKARVHVGLQGLEALGRELESQRRHVRRCAEAASTIDRKLLRELADEVGRVKRVFEELSQELSDASAGIDLASSELREQVMKLRMVPIGRVFSKYRRTVRELSHGLGKKVQLVIEGAETELDKVLVEQLDDPLTHLVRNSIDHGLEIPAVRRRADKPEFGTLTLRASNRGNQIVVLVEDDGAGIDLDKVKQKAIDKGMVTDAEVAEMDERRAIELIFRPGFSTTSEVTDLSGRGVGMDVVRETISRLKGTVEVWTRLGHGTTTTLRLPLTLAIIKVLLVRVGGEMYALPLDVVSRTLSPAREAFRAVTDRLVLHDRDREIPIIELRAVLGLGRVEPEPSEASYVALVDVAGETYGLSCDMLLGQQEIVIKSMGDLLQDVPGAAGATLIGDRCVIILDVPAIIAMSRGRSSAVRSRAQPTAIEAGSGSPAAKRPQILLAEDSDTVRLGMKRLLEQAGYAVTEARDGAEALDLALSQTCAFDLVSTDVMMPNLDGYELCRRLRETEQYREVPIVMVTSRAEKIDRIRGFDVGVDEYIVKPLDRTDLLRAIRKLVRQAPES